MKTDRSREPSTDTRNPAIRVFRPSPCAVCLVCVCVYKRSPVCSCSRPLPWCRSGIPRRAIGVFERYTGEPTVATLAAAAVGSSLLPSLLLPPFALPFSLPLPPPVYVSISTGISKAVSQLGSRHLNRQDRPGEF